MKGQVKGFSGILSKGLPKVVGRFLAEMVYGILSQHSVHVARIARSLNEGIRVIKTLNRLCRQLGREGLEEKLTENLIEDACGHVKKDTLLIADISDVSKKYARKMEHLANVRDGSEDKITKGYWTMKVIGAEMEKGKIIPLYEWRQGAILPECPGLHQRERGDSQGSEVSPGKDGGSGHLGDGPRRGPNETDRPVP
jgi:hypothetical protein